MLTKIEIKFRLLKRREKTIRPRAVLKIEHHVWFGIPYKKKQKQSMMQFSLLENN